jgi:hypothetical protein
MYRMSLRYHPPVVANKGFEGFLDIQEIHLFSLNTALNTANL